jgi:hypothetical protein
MIACSPAYTRHRRTAVDWQAPESQHRPAPHEHNESRKA